MEGVAVNLKEQTEAWEEMHCMGQSQTFSKGKVKTGVVLLVLFYLVEVRSEDILEGGEVGIFSKGKTAL